MIEPVYVIKDELSGKFSLYGSFVNKAVAERAFRATSNDGGMPTTDLMLYESGTFDHDTGVFDGYATPIFIRRGEKIAEI